MSRKRLGLGRSDLSDGGSVGTGGRSNSFLECRYVTRYGGWPDERGAGLSNILPTERQLLTEVHYDS